MMRIGLAAVGFKDKDIDYNKNTIINLMKQYSGNADMLVFGESFLQGIEVLTWKYEEDKSIAKELTDAVITEISEKAKQYGIAVSFGFIENDNKTEELHSTQITIGDDGKIVNVFRRVSEGWKEGDAINNLHYTEGREFPKFTYKGYNFSVGLCGDFWYDDNADIVKNMKTGEVSKTGLPTSNVLYYELENDAWCCVRPSGTEPKIKLYMGVKASTDEEASKELENLKEAMQKLVTA